MVNKEMRQLYKIAFAEEAAENILKLINFDDIKTKEEHNIFINNYYWHIYKTFFGENLIEINISRKNYITLKDKPKGNRIYERAFVYLLDTNKDRYTRKDAALNRPDGYIIEQLSFQNYRIEIE
jgi:hypothetical protein